MRISWAERAGLYQIVAHILGALSGRESNWNRDPGLRKALPLATFFRAFGADKQVLLVVRVEGTQPQSCEINF